MKSALKLLHSDYNVWIEMDFTLLFIVAIFYHPSCQDFVYEADITQ